MSKAPKRTQPVDKAQADIRQLMGTIRLKAANPTVPQPSVAPPAKEKPVARRPIIYDSPSADPPPIATVRDPRLSNSYARALFFDHTNVSDVVESRMLGRSEPSKEKYANTIYETYAVQPSLRIREPLHQISFDTTYHEGLFRMAQTMPLNSAEQFTAYRGQLRSAGVKQLCFVDMTQNNCVLEDQNGIVAKVKSRFNNWSAKLNKLTEYLTRTQRIREKKKNREREVLRKAVLEHSNLQSLNSSMLQNVQAKLIDELLHPSEPGMLPILRHFQFNEDSLNQRYRTGKYFSNRLLPAHVAIFTNNGITSSREVSLNCSIVSDVSINRTENVGMGRPSEIAPRESLPTTSKNVLVGIEPLQQRSVLSVGSGAPNATSAVNRRLPFQSPARNAQENRPRNESTSQVNPVVTNVAAPNTGVDKDCGKPRSYFTLRFVKQNTNVYELLQTLYLSLQGVKLSDAELEINVLKYYKKFRSLFAVNQLPQGLRLLTAEERAKRAHQRKSETSTARKEIIEQNPETSRSRQSHENSSVSSPPPKRHCAQTKPVPSRKRPIVYAEDSLNENELVIIDHTTNPLPSQELETPDSINFLPTICSTQNTENLTLHVETTVQGPVPAGEPTYANVSQTSIETVPMETCIPIISAIKTESTNVPIKVEPNTQPEKNTSGYEEYVQVISQPEPEVIEIDDSCSESIIDYAPTVESTSFRLLTNALFRPPEQNAARSSQGRQNLNVPESSLSLNLHYLSSIHARKRRRYENLPFRLTSHKPLGHDPHQRFEFLTQLSIASFRYTSRPIRWTHCNDLQQNRLTVNIHHRASGHYSVSVRDQDVRVLLGLPAGGRSWDALVAALRHTERFRYGAKEPTGEYYRQPFVEKVLRLYLDSVPMCTADGGTMLVLDERSLPNSDLGACALRVEEFDYYQHSGRNRAKAAAKVDNLARCLLPDVAEKMKDWKSKQTSVAVNMEVGG